MYTWWNASKTCKWTAQNKYRRRKNRSRVLIKWHCFHTWINWIKFKEIIWKTKFYLRKVENEGEKREDFSEYEENVIEA